MKKIQHINTIYDYNAIVSQQTLHPLISIIDFAALKPVPKEDRKKSDTQALSFGFYSIFLKESSNCEIRYGRNYYDYREGTLVFIGPDQIVSIEEDGEDYQPNGMALLFHPDLIRGTSLAQHMKDFTFFSYDVHEALHLSDEEKQIVQECFRKIDYELTRAIDKHSKRLITSNIELFLNYCVRFYDRQFIIRDVENTGIMEKFAMLLSDYFSSEKPRLDGVPTVSFFADQLHLSPNYLGDLIKKETGKTALEHIQQKLIGIAKEKIFDPSKTISEIAYEIGFKYPQHFTRFFKQQVGYTPNEYRMLN